MQDRLKTGFTDRLKASNEAKKAMLANFRPKPAVTDPNFEQREALKAAEVERIRQERADAKAAKKEAAEEKARLALEAEELVAQSALDAKRGERKERKALTKAEAKAKRDQRYAARKARQ